MLEKKPQILIIDDEKDILSALRRMLINEPVNVFLTDNFKEAMNILEKEPVQVVISDQRMPYITGISFLKQVKLKHPKIIRILFTGYEDVKVSEDAKCEAQVYALVVKPWDVKTLKALIRKAIRAYGPIK